MMRAEVDIECLLFIAVHYHISSSSLDSYPGVYSGSAYIPTQTPNTFIRSNIQNRDLAL